MSNAPMKVEMTTVLNMLIQMNWKALVNKADQKLVPSSGDENSAIIRFRQIIADTRQTIEYSIP